MKLIHRFRWIPFGWLLAGGGVALAQQYTISTVAGGSPPATPAAAMSISIGPPHRTTLDRAGNVYFSSLNSVFRIDASGTLTLVAGDSRAGYAGDGGPAVKAQLNQPQGLAFDYSGNLYIADSGNNVVRQVTPDGIISTFAGVAVSAFPGSGTYSGDGGPATSAQLYEPCGVSADTAGNIYIADTANHVIREVTPAGIISTFAGLGRLPGYYGDLLAATSGQLNTPEDVLWDSNGTVYIADTGNAVVRSVTTDGIIHTVAGDNTLGFSGDGAAATSAQLNQPFSLAIDGAGNYYILDLGNGRVRQVNTKGIINTVAGNGGVGFAGDGGPPLNAGFNLPSGLASDSSGNLYIADQWDYRIRKSPASGNMATIAGNGLVSYSGNGGSATNAQLSGPQGVALDASGNLYIADTLNNVVRKVSANGTITLIAGTGVAGFSGDGGAAVNAQLNGPQGLAVDKAGDLYIADTQNNRVREVTPNGSIATVAGNGTQGFSGDGAAATSAELNQPFGLAISSSGILYIAEFGNSRVRQVSSSGVITTAAGIGVFGYSGDGGLAVNAKLNGPFGVAVDTFGNLYIADTQNNRVREVSPNGTINTVVGSGLPGYSGDGGPALNAQVGSPASVAVDSGGNIYVADMSARVRRVYPNGIINTIAGDGAKGYSGDGGLAIDAQLNGPSALAMDAADDIFVADTFNSAVRFLQLGGQGVNLKAVTNAATNQTGALAPGEAVTLYGSGLGPAQMATYQVGSNGLVGTNLAGTSVTFGGIAAPVLYTESNQVGAIVPYEIEGPNVQVFVQYQGQSSAPLTLAVAPVAPGVITVDGSGAGQALATNQSGGFNTTAQPAPVGSAITVYVTGVGKTSPAGVDGLPSPSPGPIPYVGITVLIGGQQGNVLSANGAPGQLGLTEISVQIPNGVTAGSAVPIVVEMGGISSPNGVTIAISADSNSADVKPARRRAKRVAFPGGDTE